MTELTPNVHFVSTYNCEKFVWICLKNQILFWIKNELKTNRITASTTFVPKINLSKPLRLKTVWILKERSGGPEFEVQERKQKKMYFIPDCYQTEN